MKQRQHDQQQEMLDEMLFQAAKAGDLHVAMKALSLGADIGSRHEIVSTLAPPAR